MSQIISAAPTPHDAIQQLMRLVRDLFCVEAGTLYRYDQASDELVFEVVFGSQQALLDRSAMPAGRGIAGAAFRNGEPLLIADVSRDARFAREYDRQSGFQTRSMLCVPLVVAGRRWGVLQLINKLDGDFTASDLLTLRMVSFMTPVVEALGSLVTER